MLFIFQQKNETESAIEQTYDIIADGFNDTYMATKRPTVSVDSLIVTYWQYANETERKKKQVLRKYVRKKKDPESNEICLKMSDGIDI